MKAADTTIRIQPTIFCLLITRLAPEMLRDAWQGPCRRGRDRLTTIR